jgi:predicted RNA-binding protein with PUA-like domain
MTYFLAKTEPKAYSIEQLERDKTTVWDGVRNAQALRAIQQMKPHDNILIYHSLGETSIVGLARVTSDPRLDPKDEKSWVVDVTFVRRFGHPVTLQEIKATHRFDDWSLIRQGRLSVMEVPTSFITWLKEKKVL